MRKLLAGTAFVLLGGGLMAVIVWPLTPPAKPPESPPLAANTVRVIPIVRPPPSPPAKPVSPPRVALAEPSIEGQPPPIVNLPVDDDPPPAKHQRQRRYDGGDICQRHGGHRVEFHRGRWPSWRCVYARH